MQYNRFLQNYKTAYKFISNFWKFNLKFQMFTSIHGHTLVRKIILDGNLNLQKKESVQKEYYFTWRWMRKWENKSFKLEAASLKSEDFSFKIYYFFENSSSKSLIRKLSLHEEIKCRGIKLFFNINQTADMWICVSNCDLHWLRVLVLKPKNFNFKFVFFVLHGCTFIAGASLMSSTVNKILE